MRPPPVIHTVPAALPPRFSEPQISPGTVIVAVPPLTITAESVPVGSVPPQLEGLDQSANWPAGTIQVSLPRAGSDPKSTNADINAANLLIATFPFFNATNLGNGKPSGQTIDAGVPSHRPAQNGDSLKVREGEREEMRQQLPGRIRLRRLQGRNRIVERIRCRQLQNRNAQAIRSKAASGADQRCLSERCEGGRGRPW